MRAVTKIRLKVGDMVIVRSGRDKGKTGRIQATHPRLNKVSVEGINVLKRHQKPTRANPQGGIIEAPRPIWVSKLGLLHPTTKQAKRVAHLLDKDGNKQRVYAGSQDQVKVRVPKADKS